MTGRGVVTKFIVTAVLLWVIALALTGSDAKAQAREDGSSIVVENGTVMLKVVYGNEESVSKLLPYLQNLPEFSNVAMVLLQPKTPSSMVLLSGADEASLLRAAAKLQGLLAEAGRPHRLIISAYLREMNVTNNNTTGIDWSTLTRNLTFGVNRWDRRVDDSTYTYSPSTRQWEKTAQGQVTDTLEYGFTGLSSDKPYTGVDIDLSRALATSRVIMGSNLYTPNGIQGEIVSQTIVPVETTDKNGNSTLDSQTISSDVKITPTVIKYNPDNPEESIVKLDIYMQMSLITGDVAVGRSSAKEFSTKSLSTMGYVKADNKLCVAGVFAGDTTTKSVSGIPLLMNIPFLKRLFSQESTQTTHKIGVLTVAVRVLPESEF